MCACIYVSFSDFPHFFAPVRSSNLRDMKYYDDKIFQVCGAQLEASHDRCVCPTLNEKRIMHDHIQSRAHVVVFLYRMCQ